MTATVAILGYLAAVSLCVLVIRRAGRETERADRFVRLVDEADDWR